MIPRRRLFSAMSRALPPSACNAPLPNRRVVVTGLGTVNPLGLSVDTSWKRLVEGEIGIDRIPLFEEAGLPVHIGAKVKVGSEDHDEEYLNKDELFSNKRAEDVISYFCTCCSQRGFGRRKILSLKQR